jgi:predicted O-methyltransferase YrrM
MTNLVLAERYAQACATPTDVYEHLPVFVAAVEELDAKKIIELGVRYGVSTIAWLHGLQTKEHSDGHLWSVDCSFPVAAAPFDINLLDPQGPLGVVPWWSFLLGYDTWPEILDMLPKEDVDIVFIDTNHVYEETLVELDLYYPRVRKGGRIYLHDTALETTGNATTEQPMFPVRTAMEEWCEAHNLEFDNNPRCFGLGTIYCT